MGLIEELSDDENKLVFNAIKDYGESFEHAIKLVLFISNFISGQVKAEGWVFIGFLTQVRNSLMLALLSTIRRHDVQSLFMLRYALEASVLACYSLYHTEPSSYAYKDDKGLLIIKTNIKDKAYKWIEKEYKVHSDKIKGFKDYINSNSAHANIGPAFHNADFSEDGSIVCHFFDMNIEDPEHFELMIRQRLWWIANISFGLVDLLSNVIAKYPIVSVIEDFDVLMQMYGQENEKIKSVLKKHPRFSLAD